MNQHISALIIGAGPTGLTMAHELIRHNIDFRIIDKHAQPTQTSNALAIQTRSVEMLDNMDILQPFLEQGVKIKGLRLHEGRELIAILSTEQLPSPYHFILGVPQNETEQILTRNLEQHQHRVERGLTLVELQQDGDTVSAQLKSGDGRLHNITCDWLLACDGAHSSVRELIDMPFSGQDIAEQFILADVHVESTLTDGFAHVFFSDEGLFALFPLPNNRFRLIANIGEHHDNKQAVTLKQLQTLVDKRSEQQIKVIDSVWTSTFFIHNKMTAHMRKGRVFILGDAAHIHSPAGGQGMNTGMQDAYNLAWKLALVHHGRAKSLLLDSYEEERHPVAAGVLNDTEHLTKFALIKNPILRWCRRMLIKLFMQSRKMQRRFIAHLTQLSLRYRFSSLIEYETAVNSGSPLPGERVPDVSFQTDAGTHHLGEYLKKPLHHLLIFSGKKNNTAQAHEIENTLQQLQQRFAEQIEFIIIETNARSPLYPELAVRRIHDPSGQLTQAFHIDKPALYLLRPDNYIGFSAHIDDVDKLHDHLQQYLV